MASTLFNQVNYTVGTLVQAIEMGSIGLPHIQRPFVWPNTKVRDLFDSMYRGYPVGYLLFWKNSLPEGQRTIGTQAKQLPSSLLIVDGQQRLVSLFAVLKGVKVVREDYSEEYIEIAFDPLRERFEVVDAAIRRDRAFVPNISTIWATNADLFAIVEEYLTKLKQTREVSAADVKRIQSAFTRLNNMVNFPLTALELVPEVNEEEVAEVFVRINSKGTQLNQADFILTLMSVFWDEGRKELERFCRETRTPAKHEASSFNLYIEPQPDQLLRAAVGCAFRRARLQHVYSILRGKDLETEQFSTALRDKQFGVLKRAQDQVLNLQYWHDFWKAIHAAGYCSGAMITSENGLMYAYTLYLIGRTEFRVDEKTLRSTIARWFFMTSMTGRYSASPESKMESDLARLADVGDGGEFVRRLNRICDDTLTRDYWNITLPQELATSAARSPSGFAYYAALAVLDAPVLFSDQSVMALLQPPTKAPRAPLERHHLFPKNYLKRKGITESRMINQIANLTLIEYGDNSKIADKGPSLYVPTLSDGITKKQLTEMYRLHALPDGWEEMEYEPFLEARRDLMARVVRDAYAKLREGAVESAGDAGPSIVEALVAAGEGKTVEFKSTLRTNLHTMQKDPRIEFSCMRTIAGFLNASGGTLIIGVADNGDPVGLDVDSFPNQDKLLLHLDNLVKTRFGMQYAMYIQPRFEDHRGVQVLAVDCSPAKSAVYLKDGDVDRFFIRAGASTAELTMSEAQAYIKQRF
jgi:hypothetical protein